MTSVIALIDDGISYMAADSLLVTVPSEHHSGISQTVKRESKIFKKDGILFGASGDVRMAQLLRYKLVIPEYVSGKDKMTYLVSEFIEAFRACLDEAIFHKADLGGHILLVLDGEIFTIGEKFQVCNTADSYDSIGKTSEVAIGSLYTTHHLGVPPQERLLLALRSTEHHTCAVSEPFWYISSQMEQPKIFP